jgi:hypothetical protein
MAFIAFIPIVLRIISALTAIAGLLSGSGVASGEYAATPSNFAAIGAWLIASAGSLIGSFFAGPTSWETVRKYLDRIFVFIHGKIGIDKDGKSDLDERAMSWLADQLIMLLMKIVEAGWPVTKEEALKNISALRHCQLVEESGPPPDATVAAFARPSSTPSKAK